MKRQFKTRPLVFLLLFLSIMGWTAAANVWGYDTPGIDLRLYTDPAHPDVTYQLGAEPIPLIMVQRNVAFADLVTQRGFSEEELHHYLIVKDPTGRKHYLNAGAPKHEMPIPFFFANRAWGKAESLPNGWERSVLVDDMRNHIAEMNRIAGWYTIQAQQPFVRYATRRIDASLGDLADLEDFANWEGVLVSNVLQVYVAPVAGARLDTQVNKREDNVESPLAQIAVRVFAGDSVPANAELQTVWSTATPVLTGTTNIEGAVVWAAASVCLTRDDYVVVARYGGNYEGAPIAADDEPGWAAECQGAILRTIVFEVAPPAVPGDLNEDGVLDTTDYNLMRSALRTCTGDPNFIAVADYDGDGCITFADYRVWFGYYSNR